MHKVELICSFVSAGHGVFNTESGLKDYFFFNVLSSDDSSIDRFSCSREIYNDVKDFVMGDSICIKSDIRYVPSSRSWLLRVRGVDKI